MTGAALTRRQLLRHCTLLPLAALPLLSGCNKASIAQCADPEFLSRGEEQMRETLEYVAVSPNAQQQCTNCEFFSAADAKGCGHCEILDGPVSGQGYCTSWAGLG